MVKNIAAGGMAIALVVLCAAAAALLVRGNSGAIMLLAVAFFGFSCLGDIASGKEDK